MTATMPPDSRSAGRIAVLSRLAAKAKSAISSAPKIAKPAQNCRPKSSLPPVSRM
jgi:hypothetical protein